MHKVICKYYFIDIKVVLFLGYNVYKYTECYFLLIRTLLCLLRSIISTSKELSIFKSAFPNKITFVFFSFIIKRENKIYFFRIYFENVKYIFILYMVVVTNAM